jgi:T5orf172 domain
VIYFIRSPGGRIKIGTTIRLSERLKQLVAEHGEGLEVLAVVEGSYEAEKGLHDRFGHLRIVNEWFEPGDDLVGFIVAEGRPWDGSDEKNVKPIRLDLSPSDFERLERVAKRMGLTKSAYARMALFARMKADEAKIQ